MLSIQILTQNKGKMHPLFNETNSLAEMAISKLHVNSVFTPGVSPIPVTGKVFDRNEIAMALRASCDFWLTAGPYVKDFEKKLADRIQVRTAHMVNSGSSANLVALSALTSSKLGNRALVKGDEVLTVAAGFPTTVTPILQNGLIPVFADIDLGTYVINEQELESGISTQTRAIMLAHTLGNPFNLEIALKLAKKHNLWLIEDGCDALGGTFQGMPLGSFGDMSTLSFYPAHHITTGEGGAVMTKRAILKPIIESFRDWGRDCWCDSGCDNTCQKRFEWKLGDLPYGYDHKYTYSHLGYNLKSGEIAAAIGIAQLEKLEEFVDKRRSNWEKLRSGLEDLQDFLILPEPTIGSKPSWFGFAITLRENIGFERNLVIKKLNEKNIGTRLLFGGNLLKQPAFKGTPSRIVGQLENTNLVMNNTFWIGVWPGLSEEMLEYMITEIHAIFSNKLLS